jgi:peptidoglycan/LPS O-acetylase OafA/YrhL
MRNRIEGIDYLRAIMSVFVVVWHMGGGGRSLIFSTERYLDHVFTLSDLVNFHLLLLAVPIFLLVSNYLYACQPANTQMLCKRIKRIMILLTFWPPVYIATTQGIDGLVNLIPDRAGTLIILVFGAGNTIYYFFVCLLFSTLITHIALRLTPASQLVAGIASVVFVAGLPWLTISSGFFLLSAYWSPLNVIPFSFAAVLVAQNRAFIQSNKIVLLVISVALSVLLSVMEWHYAVGGVFFRGQGFAIPAYTRTSLLFASLAILILALDERIKSNRIVNFMAKYSLALYCIHPFLIKPVQSFVSTFVQTTSLFAFSSIVFVIIFSYMLSLMLRYYIKENVMM